MPKSLPNDLPPLSWEDALKIIGKLQPELGSNTPSLILIGGQAVLFWQVLLGTKAAKDEVETSADIDFMMHSKDAVERCAKLLGVDHDSQFPLRSMAPALA